MARLRYLFYGTGAGAGVLASQMWWVRAKFRLPPDACGPSAGVCLPPPSASKPQTPDASRQRNIVFLGDSIVTGVGCSREASAEHGPVMPRRVAQTLAQQLGVAVGWSTIGETGADVSMCRSRLLPRLQGEVQRVTTAGQRIDAVVVMTGLNDIKECFLFCQPTLHHWRFGYLLTSLLGSIGEMAGRQCSLVVPGTPVDAVPRFNELWPLSTAVCTITRLWEDQKRLAAEAAQAAAYSMQACAAAESESQLATTQATPTGGGRASVHFLEPPPEMIHRLKEGGRQTAYFAADGMHPNDGKPPSACRKSCPKSRRKPHP